MSEIKNFDCLFRLDGKVALVTGGSRGLGLHTATAFLIAGAEKVIITARKAEGPQGIDQAVKKLNNLSGVKGRAVGVTANVSNEAEILRLVKKIEQEEGKLDILVANAGATWGSTFEDAPDHATEKILNLNVRGVFLLAQKFAPLLGKSASQRDPSRIIIVSSVAGKTVPHTGENGTIMYAVSKAAATHLGKNLALELGPRNITTNVVSPGFFPSKLASGLIDILGGTKELEEANPRKRLGEPDDIAGVMIYLCSPAGSYINGVDISVDGGMMYKAGRFAKL
ncbi:NAD(P)-binding protein [Cadophora sp. DSE1049]|nr:NAD(P)-binding protein [Cadophora sp. DSE1049]